MQIQLNDNLEHGNAIDQINQLLSQELDNHLLGVYPDYIKTFVEAGQLEPPNAGGENLGLVAFIHLCANMATKLGVTDYSTVYVFVNCCYDMGWCFWEGDHSDWVDALAKDDDIPLEEKMALISALIDPPCGTVC